MKEMTGPLVFSDTYIYCLHVSSKYDFMKINFSLKLHAFYSIAGSTSKYSLLCITRILIKMVKYMIKYRFY